ncbi:MAG: hypothetical protein WD696_17135 [Bryobacteraceae bacterium]
MTPGMIGAVEFRFYRFRFHFRAIGSLHFPSGKSANLVRGAFGASLRRVACEEQCPGTEACEIAASCAYARIFQPGTAKAGPSGLADWPRPFVFRAAHLDGLTIRPDQRFHFDVHVFDVRDPALAWYTKAFAQLAREGLGPGRAKAELEAVECLGRNGGPGICVSPGDVLPPPLVLDLAPETASRLLVRFLTPTELKTGTGPAQRPEFGILFARARDRLSTLRALYGEGPLAIDFRAMGERAANVKLARWDWGRVEVERRSSRTGQTHSLGGFVAKRSTRAMWASFCPICEPPAGPASGGRLFGERERSRFRR